jgi:hypothetical protein
MRLRLTSPRLVATLLLACGAALLTAVPSALAINAPAVNGAPTLYTNGTSITVGWGAVPPDLGYDGVSYSGDLNGAEFSTAATSFTFPLGGEGSFTFRVRATETSTLALPPLTSGDGTATVVVDRTPPIPVVTLNPAVPNGDNGWYRSLSIAISCGVGGAPVTCPAGQSFVTLGQNLARPFTATDAAGNVGGGTVPAFNFDNAAPRSATLRQPTPRAVVTAEPTFVFGPSTGTETSGFNRYEVYVRVSGTYRRVASVPHVVGQAEYRVTRDPALWPTVLPKGVSTSWYVRTIDNAGNGGGGTGQARAFTINPNAPAPPTFTGGPEGLTNLASPTFSWVGDQPGFTWEVFAAENDTALQTGGGGATQATAGPLADGEYTFRVSQVNAFGDEGAEAARSFTVDATPPGAPVITGRPPFPTSNPSPTFSWAMEPGAFARWQVLGSGGAVIQTSDTPASSATVSPLTNGAYVFRVVQIDPAGNASAATSDPFSIAGVAAPVKVASLTSLLPLQNAKRLKPGPGKTLVTRTPVLQWTKGPRGTTLYNLQLFKVIRKRPNLPPVVTKVYSAFPRGTQFRLPKSKTLPGTCYIWRIWPYTGKSFTKSPLGISNFCIASKAKLAKAAKAAAAKKKRK